MESNKSEKRSEYKRGSESKDKIFSSRSEIEEVENIFLVTSEIHWFAKVFTLRSNVAFCNNRPQFFEIQNNVYSYTLVDLNK